MLGGRAVYISHSLTIDATSVGGVTIDAGGQSRVILTAGDTEVSLTGLTVTGGEGTGISNYGTLELTNSTVYGNGTTYQNAGGIFNHRGTLTLTNSMVVGNSASARRGGGIYNWGGSVLLTNSEVTDNSASYGGGIYSTHTGRDLVNSLVLVNSTVSRNSANNDGGGILDSQGTIAVYNSTLVGNSAGDDGGGVKGYWTSITLVGSMVAGNSANDDGGGLCLTGGDTTTALVADSTISGNWAQDGGGIWTYGGTLTLGNTIVAVNEASTDADVSGSYTNNNSMIGGDPGFVRNPDDGGDGWGDDPSTTGVDEGANDDYGDLRLTAASPARDTGDNALLPDDEYDLDGDSNTDETLPVDLAGNQRIRNLTVDMGAYEYAQPGDADDDGDVDGADLAAWQQNYDPVGLNDNTFEMADFDGDGDVDGADLAIWQINYDPVGAGEIAAEFIAESAPVGGLALEPIADDASEAMSIEAGKSGDRHVSPREDCLQSSLEPVPVLPSALGVSVIDDARKAGTGTSRFARLSQSPFFTAVEQSAIASPGKPGTGTSHFVRLSQSRFSQALIQEEPVDVLRVAEVDAPLG